MVKPGASSFHPASLVALLCSIFFSLYLLSTRALQMGQSPPPTLVLLAYQCAPGAFALAACLPLVWSPLAGSQILTRFNGRTVIIAGMFLYSAVFYSYGFIQQMSGQTTLIVVYTTILRIL